MKIDNLRTFRHSKCQEISVRISIPYRDSVPHKRVRLFKIHRYRGKNKLNTMAELVKQESLCRNNQRQNNKALENVRQKYKKSC